MKRIIFLFAFLITLGLLSGACTPAAIITQTATAEPSPTAMTFIDGLNRTVSLPATPARIISLAPSNTEILYAIGAGAQMIARDEFSDVPADAKALPTVGGNMGKYDLEKITSLKPDLVIAAEINTPEQVKALEDLKINVYYLSNPTDLPGMYANLATVGKLTGHQPEADKLIESLKSRVKAVEDKMTGVTNQPKAFYELDGTDPAKPWTTGPGTFMDQLIKMAGGTNAAANMNTQWGQISQEELLIQNPEVILLGDAAYGVTPDQLKQRPGWDKIKAVANGNIQTFDDNLVSRPGPRLVDGLETLARLLHPELYKQ
jgi:iron complex transport system substrate-binding protein